MNAIFLDRDGTINEDVGDLYEPEKLVFIKGAIRAMKALGEKFLLFVITNQSGIGKGAFSEEDYARFNDYFTDRLKKEGITITDTYCCPHTKEEECACRKPGVYFLEKAAKEHKIDLSASYVIGDHPHDIELAHRVGARSIYLLTGHGKKHERELSAKPDLVANDLAQASKWIMDTTKNGR